MISNETFISICANTHTHTLIALKKILRTWHFGTKWKTKMNGESKLNLYQKKKVFVSMMKWWQKFFIEYKEFAKKNVSSNRETLCRYLYNFYIFIYMNIVWLFIFPFSPNYYCYCSGIHLILDICWPISLMCYLIYWYFVFFLHKTFFLSLTFFK